MPVFQKVLLRFCSLARCLATQGFYSNDLVSMLRSKWAKAESCTLQRPVVETWIMWGPGWSVRVRCGNMCLRMGFQLEQVQLVERDGLTP